MLPDAVRRALLAGVGVSAAGRLGVGVGVLGPWLWPAAGVQAQASAAAAGPASGAATGSAPTAAAAGAEAELDPVATWTADGRPLPRAADAVALLADAASHGLEPADYDAGVLQQELTRLASGTGATSATPATLATLATSATAAPDTAAVAVWATRLHGALLRFLRHLHFGRIDPTKLHLRYPLPARDAWDASTVLRDAIAAGRLGAAVDAAVPTLPLYGQLRVALARYRAWGDDPAWQQPLPPLPGRDAAGAPLRPLRLLPGLAWPGLPVVAARLQRLGDLGPGALVAAAWDAAAQARAQAAVQATEQAASGAALHALPPSLPATAPQPPPLRLQGTLLDALRRFQRRHGLSADGVLGAATRAALDVSPARRAEQIGLTLERLRWTPLRQGRRMIIVNVPEFVLRACEFDASGRLQVRASMRVVVGRTRDAQTPLFSELMRHIEFAPYWNVPASIARAELMPQFRRGPARFQAGGFEFVLGNGEVDTAWSLRRLDEVMAGRARLRQRPGAANALGDIKFVFPNADAIYLHHTPAVQLFERERRDFSHGCIRVEDPVGLAQFVLAGQPGWDEARIRAAMAAGRSTVLPLIEPLPVVIAYGTALVTQDELRFFPDLYGHDAVLASALQQARR